MKKEKPSSDNNPKPNTNPKKKRAYSLFTRMSLLMFLIILILDGVVLMLTYKISYDNNLQIFEDQLRGAAKATVHYCETYNVYNDQTDEEIVDPLFDNICELFNVTYIYVVEPNLDTRSETYLEIAFGDDASEEAKETRFRGVTVKGKLNDSEIEAYNGNTDGVIKHEVTQFDDALICYMPCTHYVDADTGQFVQYKKPLIVASEIAVHRVNARFKHRFAQIVFLTLSITLLIAASFALLLYFKVTKPLRVLSDRMSSFVADRKKGIRKLDEKGGREFAQMAHSFNTMTEDINRYIDDIDALNRDKHTTEAELNIAREIQMGLLLPGHLHSDRYAINAYVKPAKDVGGDYYDYSVLDDGRIFVAVADVSGKGISASLFMARAITLLHQNAIGGHLPSEILETYNNTLTQRNPGGLFITTFVVIYDPSTGILTYSNAGHNIPYLLSDTLIPLDKAHGVAAGLFDGEVYEDATVMIKPGDSLFLYTDGVNEAKSAENGFYSTERLEEKLRDCIAAHTDNTLDVILDDLHGFTKGAEQNDDITILTLQTTLSTNETILRLRSEVEQLHKLKEAIFALPISDDSKRTIYLAAEEIFVNICSYAYDSPNDAIIRLYHDQNHITLTFIDSGRPFDPTRDVLDINDYDHENAIGGLGRYLAFSIAESYRYEYIDDKNILQLTFSEEEQNDDHKEA